MEVFLLSPDQAILDRDQGGPIPGVAGVRLGESGEQTITQIRRRNWGGWVQDGAVQSHLPRMRSWLSESGGLALYPKSAAQYNRACLTSGTRISCVRACLSILRGRFPAWASA